ncbi:MAG: hypothetical protein HYS17_02475 [Micavibrio aeruginosavorus]|uniref:DUF1570 domain-containing protein n=1 Tax=Micavibrio aeruginosavorus TaxID=349221 RepID=A0A7T5R373_9BACT|nr:MAG: hypothetical protein HYS17_02475 [Micavibrio aeruginosavorus]
MSRHQGEASGRSIPSIAKKPTCRPSLTALFIAAAMLTSAAPAIADTAVGQPLKFKPGNDNQVSAATTLVVQPSETALSRRVAELQQRFGNLVRDVKLVVIDKDWFQKNAVLNGVPPYQYALPPAQAQTVRQLTEEFVRSRSGLPFPAESFTGLEKDMLSAEAQSYRRPYGETERDIEGGQQNICLLFPHYADWDRDFYYRTLLGLNPAIHGDIARAPLRDPQSLEFLKRFVDYHEIGHCYDRWNVPQMARAQNGGQFLTNRHRAEVFAEVFANLMLARDGYAGFSQKQADFRLAIAGLSGPVKATLSSPREVDFYMTSVYLLHEGSRNAGMEIERLGNARLQAMNMEEILNMTNEITNRSVLDLQDVSAAVGYMMYNAYDFTSWEEARLTNPVIERRYQIAQRLKADMESAVQRTLDLGARSQPVLQPSSFNFERVPTSSLDASALQTRVRELANDLQARMGFNRSRENLIRVYAERKDELRRTLEGADAAARERAVVDLRLMMMALRQVYDSLPLTATPTRISYQMHGLQTTMKLAA